MFFHCSRATSRSQSFLPLRISAIGLLLCSVSAAQTFDTSLVDRLRISTGSYEVDLSKTNGAILDIRDPIANVSLSLGSRGGCLWGTNRPENDAYKGGCFFSPNGADSFQYKWDSAQNVLVLLYVSAAASTQRVDATVTMTFAPDHFDMAVEVTNRTGRILSYVLFPSDLVFENNSIRSAYLPYYLPGVRLTGDYFSNPKNLHFVYPGAASFADFRALDVGSSRLTWYAVNPSGRIAPVEWGLRNDAQIKAGTSYFFHNFLTWLANGGVYKSPIIRFRVGQTPDSAVLRYKSENGISAYKSVSEKLGSSFSRIAQAPLVLMVNESIGTKANPSFTSLASRLNLVRSPALLHPVLYWPVGFDRNYPDFLPPDPRYGTTRDFADFTRAAQANGMFIMPYINPTFWDFESPTVKSAGAAPFSALDPRGNAYVETYGSNRGFGVVPKIETRD